MESDHHASAQRPMKGPTVTANSKRLRHVFGSRYCARTFTQSRALVGALVSALLESLVICLLLLIFGNLINQCAEQTTYKDAKSVNKLLSRGNCRQFCRVVALFSVMFGALPCSLPSFVRKIRTYCRRLPPVVQMLPNAPAPYEISPFPSCQPMRLPLYGPYTSGCAIGAPRLR